MSERGEGRKLVICCDGTNNTLTAGTEDTNVLKLHTLLCEHRTAEHVLYYDPGVGTPDTVPPTDLFDWGGRYAERLGGLISGRGVYDNISQAYLFLMKEWRDDRDQIYCFGFSRGAFTVRCVVGMINLFGILRPEHEPMLPTLIRIYFSQPEGAKGMWSQLTRVLHDQAARPGKAAAEVAGHTEETRHVTRDLLALQAATLFAADRQPAIHWIGVWDTVESVGLPGPLARSNPATATVRDKPKMRNVRHAVSLDEHRWSFEPRLYDEPGDIDSPVQTLKQRWFPGVHCDVGGSYHRREAGLPDASFQWMVNEVAADLGLPRVGTSTAVRLHHDPMWETPWWALAGMSLRDVAPVMESGQRLRAVEDDGGSVTSPSISIWCRSRSWVSLLIATVLGAMFLLVSGLCLLRDWRFDMASLRDAFQATFDFAAFQIRSLPWLHHGIDQSASLLAYPHPAWAMFWDLLFVACWSYLLARVASRAFAALAGARRANSPMPWWRWIGFAPLAAVAGDVIENLLTLGSLAASGLGTQVVAALLLWLVGIASWCKLLGLLACVPLLAVRIALVLPDRGASRYLVRQQHP
jgi:uncharacterized protein (DUF2235 family)